jgi:4-methylaminobutanoate oxidase (formaldehyde-forming)
VLLHHDEPILCDGSVIGWVTSGAYGHRVGASLGMGWVRSDDPITPATLATGAFEVEVAGRAVRAHLQLAPFYDPKGERIRPDRRRSS